MDEAMIENWNSRISPNDSVYHLGDFAFANPIRITHIIKKLNGLIYFIKGNHDKNFLKSHGANSCQWIKDYFELKVDKQLIVLCHYPFESWRNKHHGSWHLHGHCHGTLPSSDKQKRLDVGVDVHSYFPITFDEVKEHMATKSS